MSASALSSLHLSNLSTSFSIEQSMTTLNGRPISACHRCRKLKVKCSQSRPQCQRCASAGRLCEYREVTIHPLPQALPTSPTDSKKKRTRHRAILSCLRCRKRKVRCDRQLPCGRCVAVGKEGECVLPGQSPGTTSLSAIATTYFDDSWNQRYRNETHWARLLEEVGLCL